jgi:uncharacterized membrane protein
MKLQVLAVMVIGLMCGSEFHVAAFTHPALTRLSEEVHIRVRAELGRVLGLTMPFWMTGSTLLNLALLLPVEHLSAPAWRLSAGAFGIQVLAIVFSLLGPVPMNNRIIKWTPSTVPPDWKAQEGRWDLYHWIRTAALTIAFAMLVFALKD